ncbi:hypothetical protein [Nocardia cerradoensis]|nr:hypothetical protein [Nocardia cerradoensis]NKY46063.1 hypothetical protein [Nocardia cerradoensis]
MTELLLPRRGEDGEAERTRPMSFPHDQDRIVIGPYWCEPKLSVERFLAV